jgi:hypothetical protein
MTEHRVILYRGKDEAARFQYGIHAHHAAKALSAEDDVQWRVVDVRPRTEPHTLRYFKGEFVNGEV